jgi:hypothetical protein
MERSRLSPMCFCKSDRSDLTAPEDARGSSCTAISIFVIKTEYLMNKIDALIRQKIASERLSLHLSRCEEFAILSVQY